MAFHLVTAEFHQVSLQFPLEQKELLQAWAAACHPDLLKQTRVVSIRNRKLEIRVANSLVNQQLSFDQARLLRVLQEKMPEAKLQGLIFKIGITESPESN